MIDSFVIIFIQTVPFPITMKWLETFVTVSNRFFNPFEMKIEDKIALGVPIHSHVEI